MSQSTADRMLRTDSMLVADALLRARRDRRPADATPFAASLRSADDAYEVQALVAAALEEVEAGRARCWKSGGPSREAVLTHAPLPSRGVRASPAQARDWPCNLRLIEAEVALRLGRDVAPGEALVLSHHSAWTLVDAMAVSIELVDSRWQQGVDAPPLLKLADLQSHGALVVGPWRTYAPRDWEQQECTVLIGDRPPVHRRGTHALGDPAWVLPAWLRHATRTGATVPRGTIVTTGTWCGMLAAAAGDLVAARFEGIGEASLQL